MIHVYTGIAKSRAFTAFLDNMPGQMQCQMPNDTDAGDRQTND